jgi:hypothetical protein
MNMQRLLVGGLVVAMMAHTSAMAFDDLARAGDAAAKALAIVKKAREAAGGEENLARVCVVSANGTARRTGPEGETTGPFAFKLFTSAGRPGGTLELKIPDGEMRKRIVVVRKGEASADLESGDADVSALPEQGGRIVVRKVEPGAVSVDATATGEKDVLVIRVPGPGTDGDVATFTRRAPGPGDASADPALGRRTIVFSDSQSVNGEAHGGGEHMKALARPVFEGRALESLVSLLTPVAGLESSLAYVGLLDTADGQFEAVDFTAPDGFVTRFFFDPVSHRPAMATYKSFGPRVFAFEEPATGAGDAKDKTFVVRAIPHDTQAEGVEVQVRFDDYRSAGAVLLPHRISVSSAGTLVEEITLESFTAEACQDAN